jgi:N-acetylmuramoyl-L-alanine amidase
MSVLRLSQAMIVVATMLLSPVLALAHASPHVNPTPDTPALLEATHSWKILSSDSKRKLRHDLWMEVIDRLKKIGRESETPEVRFTALLRAGEAAEDLASVSRNSRDAAVAVALYREAATAGSGTTAADASGRARRLSRRFGLPAPFSQAEVAPPLPAPSAAANPAPKDSPSGSMTPVAVPAPAVTNVADGDPKRKPEPGEDGTLAGDLSELIGSIGTIAPPPASVSRGAQPEESAAIEQIRTAMQADKTISLSEQVGLKIHRIIVDAGHGGYDAGATGPSGVHEKDVTLAIARSVAKVLRSHGYEVVLTRDSDEFVSLEDRTAIANRERGDLFLSIHANASPHRKQSGVETYALNVASSRYEVRLAARENATARRGVSDLQYLLTDLATRSNTVDSDRLAKCVQASVVESVGHKYGRPRDNGVKHALFYVLLGAKMPAVLVETQFISNVREEKHLAATSYQSLVARSIAAGVDQFVAHRMQVASAEGAR